MSASAAIALAWSRDGIIEPQAQRLIGIFAAGALAAYPVARSILCLVPNRWRKGQRFAAAFILFGAATVGFTSLFFALDFLAYFAEWHDDHLSVQRVFQTLFTVMSAFYQFLVLGLRLYLPVGVIALFGAATGFALRRL
ncbi:MAG: hypothetical protein WCC66_04555 [Rhizobiaceae bacterium]